MLEDTIKKEVYRLSKLPAKSEKSNKKIPGLVENYTEPVGKKILDALFENDLKTVGYSIINDVLMPRGKELLADMFMFGIRKWMFDDDTGATYNGYSSSRSSGGVSTSYDAYYKGGSYGAPPTLTQKTKVKWDRIILRDRRRALELLDDLREDARRYKKGVSILQMYDYLTEIDEELGAQVQSEFPDHDYGWTNFDHIPIETVRIKDEKGRVCDGYWVKFPKPVQLD